MSSSYLCKHHVSSCLPCTSGMPAVLLPEGCRSNSLFCRCCTSCGQVLDETTFSAEVTFTKGAGGISTADGQFVSDVAASRGLGRISGGRLYGYQVNTSAFIHLAVYSGAC